MKQRVLMACATAILVSCSNQLEESVSDSSYTGSQSDELEAYIALVQNVEEPAVTNSELTSKSAITVTEGDIPVDGMTRAGGSDGSGGMPSPGDTLRLSDTRRIIVDSDPEIDSSGFTIDNPEVGMKINATIQEDFVNEPGEGETNRYVTGTASWSGAVQARLRMGYNSGSGKMEVTQANWQLKEVKGFAFKGEEKRMYGDAVVRKSMECKVEFDDPSIESLLPGTSELKVKVLEAPYGVGDSAHTIVDSLDEALAIQYGDGTYYNNALGQTYQYQYQLIHRNEEDASKPFEQYQYNQAKVKFEFQLRNKQKTFEKVHAEINYNVDRDNDGSADRCERDVILTTENGDTIATISGNVQDGEWEIDKNEEFFIQ